ncbi:carbohydrate ABC transporter permease [Microbacterium sp. E-13]|uniref:carbohydrate ABC transporter permease n=1 Tax=Microbacterium sp. E-13 TaxID=3404048 RepID=UPI003CE6A69A
MSRAPRASRTSAGGRLAGWLFVAPAVTMYAAFVLVPLGTAAQYSLYDWNGIGPSRWVGLQNYVDILVDPRRLAPIGNAFFLIVFFTVVPVCSGLALASLIRTLRSRGLAAAGRTVLFLPQIVPLVAAGIAWSWVYSENGVLNQALRTLGLGSLTRAWLGDFDTALVAVGFIGTWVLTGLCTVLLLTGMGKIDPSLYESVRLDGGNWWHELRAVTLPSLMNELGVLVTLTTIAALASFDIVFITTRGGPGTSTMVPGVEVYRLAFTEREIGSASAMGVLLMCLVLLVVLPIQRFFRGRA